MGSEKNKPKIVVICGPTGVGKTAFAIESARAFGAEIIGADSMQIYRYMDIGTAKPTPEEQAQVRHHMIDIKDPDESFDAARYGHAARAASAKLHAEGVLPVIAGGTGLYIKAMLWGLFAPGPQDPQVRERLRKEVEHLGISALHRRLVRFDPESAARLHPNDTYRIIRALEILETTGKSISQFQKAHAFGDCPFDVLKVGLKMQREALYERINLRVAAMAEAGLLAEVQGLLTEGYGGGLKSMQSIGYRHMVDFIQGRVTWEEALETLKRDTRRYAKRQMTWFRYDADIKWLAPVHVDQMKRLIEGFLRPE